MGSSVGLNQLIFLISGRQKFDRKKIIMSKKKLSFYTVKFTAGWYGYCAGDGEFAGPKKTRDAAMSAIRRQKLGGKKKPKVASKKKLQLVNRFMFVLDRSGSMRSLHESLIKALNDNIETIRKEWQKTGQSSYVSIVTFDDRVEEVCTDVHANSIGLFTTDDHRFFARGNTSLLDATGVSISKLRDLNRDADRLVDAAYVVMVITDGAENSSRTWSARALNELMNSVQSTDRWTLTFLLSKNSKAEFCRTYGVPAGNVAEWDTTEEGVRNYVAKTSAGISSYYGTRSLGLNSTETFYTDLSKVTAKQVKAVLNDIRSEVKVWTVDKESTVRDFCESKSGKPLLKGSAFYALTKTEKEVQPYKQILIMRKSDNAVYAGDAARDLLGLPRTETVKLVPGNHAEYDVFIQSTSTNRLLVRGSKVVYYPSIGVPYKEGQSSQASVTR